VIARLVHTVAVAAAAFALVACGPAIPPVPSKGGPAWRELTSEHFTLWTNTSPRRAYELMRAMEDFRHVVIGVGFRGGGEGRVLVIALRDDDEVAAYIGEFRAMASDANSHINQPLILISAETDDMVVAHELTHTISFTVIREQPRWFAEGLAKYFETIKIDRERGTVDLGRAPTYRGEPMVQSRLMSFRELVACTELSCADRHFYASAWALFTYLKNVKQVDVTTYPQLIASAQLDELEAEVKRWLVSGSHTVLHYNVKLPTYPVTERSLDDADVYAARALLRLEFGGRRDLAKLDADAALAADPSHILGNVITRELGQPLAPDRARALAAAHPDDWRAWMLVVDALGRRGDEARTAFERACELSARNPALVTPCTK
jgi:hypothetical protein